MLARFENGYFLEVTIEKDDFGFHQYFYSVFDKTKEDFDGVVDGGHTEYRSMELYYPMNEIDYILEFCEPDFVEGKYKILEEDTMEDYLDYLEYGSYGDWILERQGTDNDDIRYYKTEEDARLVMLKEVEECEDGDDESINGNYCTVYGEEYFQSWSIYKKETFETEKEKLFNKIEREFVRVYVGISHYAWELQDTDVIGCHVEKLEKLVDQLKELV